MTTMLSLYTPGLYARFLDCSRFRYGLPKNRDPTIFRVIGLTYDSAQRISPPFGVVSAAGLTTMSFDNGVPTRWELFEGEHTWYTG